MESLRGLGAELGLGVPLPGATALPSHRDRKKKRFVGQTGQEDKKKVRTESGRYISSSYKNNLYPALGGPSRLGREAGHTTEGRARGRWVIGSHHTFP